MIKESGLWQQVLEKQDELRRLIEENWEKGEWRSAVLGESTIRTVEDSRESAREMIFRTNKYLETVKRAQTNG